MLIRPYLFVLSVVAAVLLAPGMMGCSRYEPPAAEQHFPVVGWTLLGLTELPGGREPKGVTLPAHLDELLPRSPSEYVLRTRVEVPPEMRGVPLTLAVAHMPAVATLRVDGNQAVPVEASTLDSYRASNPHRWRIPEEASKDGRLDLELHVSHRFVRSAWIDSVPELTTHALGGSQLAAVHTFNTVAAIGALTAALFVAFVYAVLFVSSSLLRTQR